MERNLDQAFTRAELLAEVGRTVRVAGQPVGYRLEPNRDPDRADHLFITVRAGAVGAVEIALNTYSLRNLRRDFDPRVRLAIVSSTWSELPLPGIFPSAGLVYAAIEAEDKIVYREYERVALEELLFEKTKAATFVEGWGDLYLRSKPGIHQVHSRRKNTVVPADGPGRDAAVRFFFRKEAATELLLLKFFGQE